MRRDGSRERVFFLLVLAGALLLLSGLMLRHEGAALPTRTFTEDGDEITIKRAATSKGNKITTISRDEKGKLTIEDTTAEDERQTETEPETEVEGEKQDTLLEDIPAESPSAIQQGNTGTEDEAVVVSGGKKVTVVQVNRSLTKVSVADVEEENKDSTR
ncbi:hypothetical protein PHMEG_00026573 [Phytophthora megakarya]|uniref:Uncharacterized protein n=1 Tax=Phytophthora megakarya TaxID=4795 RepID=A0A225V998_9STRA|nr:hypothetical protein PHMEG_00026573 [Phytophthora megakarya]